MFAVKHSPFDMIPQVIKRGEDDTKRPASVMRKEPNDIFKKKIQRPLLFNHSGQFKEESTSCIFKSFPPASCRKRLVIPKFGITRLIPKKRISRSFSGSP